jgi:LemA protein
MSTTEFGLIAIVVVALLSAATFFNGLVRRKNQINFSEAGINAYLKKRYDLIPNLVSTCDRYIDHERGLLTDLVKLRGEAMASIDAGRRPDDAAFSQKLRGVFAVAEAHPTLVSSENFIMLQRSLNEIEEQLSASRRAFNASVVEFNNACMTFPGNLFAQSLGFKPVEMFQIDQAEKQPIRIWEKK